MTFRRPGIRSVARGNTVLQTWRDPRGGSQSEPSSRAPAMNPVSIVRGLPPSPIIITFFRRIRSREINSRQSWLLAPDQRVLQHIVVLCISNRLGHPCQGLRPDEANLIFFSAAPGAGDLITNVSLGRMYQANSAGLRPRSDTIAQAGAEHVTNLPCPRDQNHLGSGRHEADFGLWPMDKTVSRYNFVKTSRSFSADRPTLSSPTQSGMDRCGGKWRRSF